MATDDTTRRRGRPDPQEFLPEIGLDAPMWLQNILTEMKQQLQILVVDPTPPAQVTGVVLTAVYPGILVQWNRVSKAVYYLVFRNTVPDLTTATQITELNGAGNVSFFDITSSLGTTAVYYWIQAANGLGIRGPVSMMASLQNSSPPSPGGTTPILNLDTVLLAVGSPDDDIPSLLGLVNDVAVGNDFSGSMEFWAAETDDEDFYTSATLKGDGYTIP